MLKSNLIAIAAALMLAANQTLLAMENASVPIEESSPQPSERLTDPDEKPRLELDSTIDTSNAGAPLPAATSSRAILTPDKQLRLQLEHEIDMPYVAGARKEAIRLPAGSIVIEGDSMDFHLERRMRSIGHASMKKDDQSIYGDRIEYDVQNDELHVVGNTRIEFEGLKVWGPELRMRLYDNVGEMKNPSFEMDNTLANLPQVGLIKATDLSSQDALSLDNGIHSRSSILSQNLEDKSSYDESPTAQQTYSRGDAEMIFFEGENRKRLTSARYTTCEVDHDDWYIKAGELELDNYTKTGTATDARVEFKGVPLLYAPWMNFSFMNQRKSGFLSPTIGTTSRSGFELQVPYYFNIAPEMDATVGTRLLSKRGLQLQGEFRYMDENYSGTSSAEYLPSDNLSGTDRWYFNLNHRHAFGNGWTGGYNIERISDDQYFSELSTRITVTSRVNLPQQAFVNYDDDVWSFNGLVQKFQTLDETSFPYERLPQLTLSGLKDWKFGTANLYTQWVSFDRNKNEPYTLETPQGTLNTGVTGSRFTAYPSISVPFERPYGYITPKLGLHYTTYSLNDTDYRFDDGLPEQYESGNRSLPIFSLDSGLFYEREMRVVNNRYKQTLEPRLFYVYIPYRDQSMLPVFDTSEADLNMDSLFSENQFTGNDRINDANQLTLALTTRMIDAKTGRQRLAATLGQRYYFSDQQVTMPGVGARTNNSSDIVAVATARLANDWNIDLAWQYNTDRSTIIKSNVGARYNPEPGKVLNLSYRYTEDSLEQIDLSGQWPLGPRWYGMGRWNYSMQENQPIEGLAGIEYDAGCWQARTVLQRVSTATADANYALYFQLELGGLASIGSNPLSLLQRGIPGYSASGLIPNTYE
jgi:LPS-assembly protein